MMADIVDPLAQAQAAALAKAAGASNVRPIRADVVERAAVHCLPASAFLADVEEPSWVVAGIVQAGYLYAMTAPTNHGKTAVSLVMAMCIASGKAFAGLEVQRGNVLEISAGVPVVVGVTGPGGSVHGVHRHSFM